ncbi:unnamed protein product [Prunus armeniaca]
MEKREGGLWWWSWGNDGEENGWLRRLWVRGVVGRDFVFGFLVVVGWVYDGGWVWVCGFWVR